MATQTNAIVTTLGTTIVRPHEYMGNVKVIPVNLSGDFADGDPIVFSDVMPSNCDLIEFRVTAAQTNAAALGAGMSLDVGITGNADDIIDGVSLETATTVDYFGLPYDVGGKQILGTVKGNWPAGYIRGHIKVVTDQ